MGEEKYWQIFHEINFSFFFGLAWLRVIFQKFALGIKFEHWGAFFLERRAIQISKRHLTLCSANQWTGFYMITASVMKGLQPFNQQRQILKVIFLKIICSITTVFKGLRKGLYLKEHFFSLGKSLCANLSCLQKCIIRYFSHLHFISLFWLLLR